MGILDAPVVIGRKPTIVLFGDSRTADCDFSSSTFAYSTNMSWFDWGQSALTGGPVFDVLSNAGIAGNTTTQMLARMGTDVIAKRPSYMTLWGGTNDGWATTADVDASYGRMAQMMDLARGAGIYVFLISETTGSPPLRTTPFGALVSYYNDLLRAYVASHAQIEFWDFNAVFTDPTSATGYALSTLTRDGLHLSPLGASTIGKKVVAVALARFAPVSTLVYSQLDSQAQASQSRNVTSNPLMQGTSGTIGSGHTGTLPSTWASSGNVATLSTLARTDGIGNDLKVQLAATSTSSLFVQQALTVARFTAGKRYVMEAALGIDAATNVSAVSLHCSLYDAGNVEYRRGFGYPTIASTAGDSLATGDRVLRSRVFTFPTGVTYASGAAVLRIAPAAASAAATVRLGRFSIRQLD